MTNLKFFFVCLFTMLMICVYNVGNAQTVRQDGNGNYIAVSVEKVGGKDTGKTFTDTKGNVFSVYESTKGKLYIIRKSKKTGKEYKQYLKV